MNVEKFYDHYHSHLKVQRRVINENDFTYRSLIYFLRKHSINKAKILDIGCGVGTIDFYLATLKNVVTGIDISQNAISIAKQNTVNLGLWKQLKFQRMNFPKIVPLDKFDTIICTEILEHIKEDKLAVVKIKNLLLKNGIVIASSPSENSPLYKLGSLKIFDKEVGHLRRYTEDSFRKLFTDVGLEILELKKTEGILRNFLFTNSLGGFLLKILNKWPISKIVTFLDNLTIPVFGESDIFLVAKKK